MSLLILSLLLSGAWAAEEATPRKPAMATSEVKSVSLCLEGFISNCVHWRREGAGKKEKFARERISGGESLLQSLSKKEFEAEIERLIKMMGKVRAPEDLCQPSLALTVSVKEGEARARVCSDDHDDKEWKEWARFLRR